VVGLIWCVSLCPALYGRLFYSVERFIEGERAGAHEKACGKLTMPALAEIVAQAFDWLFQKNQSRGDRRRLVLYFADAPTL